MNTAVPLGSILNKSANWIQIDPFDRYTELTVHLWGRGVSARRVVEGSEIAGQRRLKVLSGEFVVSRIDARHGAFAVIPDDLGGAIVSNDFPAYRPDTERLLPKYLGWLSRTNDFVKACRAASEGTTNRVRLKEDKFSLIKIPLPPLEEQVRIVDKIERLAAKIERANTTSNVAENEAMLLRNALERQVWPKEMVDVGVPLVEITTFLARGRQSEQGHSSHYLIKSQHVQMGYYQPTSLTLSPSAANAVKPEATVQRGDILIACSAAGCLGRVAKYDVSGVMASTDTHVAIARPDPTKVLPTYLFAYLNSVVGQHQLRSRERGALNRERVGFRLAELNLRDLKEVPIPLPALSEQRRNVAYLDGLQAKVDRLKALQAQTRAELDALLPSILDRAFKGEL